MIPTYDQHGICVELRRSGKDSGVVAEKAMWLVYLCAKGDMNRVKDFIQTADSSELRDILNKKLWDNYDGTVLNAILYWNSGNKALDLFELMVEHGADPVRDYYGNFPWENVAPLWVLPFGGGRIGERDMNEFEETYQYLREIYGEKPNQNQNASPISAPVQVDDDITIIVDRLTSTRLVARRLNFDDVADEKEDEYDDMPALVDSDDDEYDDMPALEQESDDEDEYADMPALIPPKGTRLVYSDEEDFYDE
jgi:hypothetical protein